MNQSTPFPVARSPARASRSPLAFGLTALGVALTAALLAGWVPVRFSIVTVFLFAGPHNWLEFRYFLTRMPARWGRLRGFFLLAFAGMFGLTASYCALAYLVQHQTLNEELSDLLYPLWGTVLLLWIAVLTHLRSRQNPRRDWGWVWPVCLALVAVVWLYPTQWSLALVYLHPLIALWLFDRELKRSRPEWRPAYYLCLACLPIFLGAIWWQLADAAPVAGDDELTRAISNHAGAFLLPGVSSHLLVSTHTFLEMLHYGVWILAMPLIGMRSAPWQLQTVPLARRSVPWCTGVAVFLAGGLGVVAVLWAGFLADYPTTRNVYFTVALLHVLAEAPFLLRSL